eukprot:s276_g23.t1
MALQKRYYHWLYEDRVTTDNKTCACAFLLFVQTSQDPLGAGSAALDPKVVPRDPDNIHGSVTCCRLAQRQGDGLQR